MTTPTRVEWDASVGLSMDQIEKLDNRAPELRRASIHRTPQGGYFWATGWMLHNGECGKSATFTKAEQICQRFMGTGEVTP